MIIIKYRQRAGKEEKGIADLSIFVNNFEFNPLDILRHFFEAVIYQLTPIAA
jgi:hypothetical protein